MDTVFLSLNSNHTFLYVSQSKIFSCSVQSNLFIKIDFGTDFKLNKLKTVNSESTVFNGYNCPNKNCDIVF